MNKRIQDRILSDPPLPSVKAGRRDLRRRNKHLLLHLIQTEGPSSQADLARRSGLSPATVSGILQPLIEAQVLIEEGKSTSGLGRRASMLAFNARAALSVGVSIDHEECEVALVDLSARVLDSHSAAYARDTEPGGVVGLASDCLAALIERNQVDRKGIAGVGVAIPGLINSRTGVVRVASNLGWRNVPLRALFERRLDLPVRVEHLGRAKARAEAVWGKGKGRRNFICLEIGSGIGAGVMADGRILRGHGGIGGEVGHTPIDPSGPPCACGLRGCWEVFCAGPAIRARLARKLEENGVSSQGLTPSSKLAELGAAFEAGDSVAAAVVEETAQYLARGLVGVLWNFDPEFILLTGPVVRDCPGLVGVTQKIVDGLHAARRFNVPLILEAEQAGTGVVAASAIVSLRYLEDLAASDAVPGGRVLTAV